MHGYYTDLFCHASGSISLLKPGVEFWWLFKISKVLNLLQICEGMGFYSAFFTVFMMFLTSCIYRLALILSSIYYTPKSFQHTGWVLAIYLPDIITYCMMILSYTSAIMTKPSLHVCMIKHSIDTLLKHNFALEARLASL